MPYSFTAYGHPNITGKHKTTLEFTKDKDISKRADCIIGVKADFDPKEIKKILKKSKKVKITIKADGIVEGILCDINPDFNNDKEVVIRKSGFVSERTLGINADKACIDLGSFLLKKLKKSSQRILIRIY